MEQLGNMGDPDEIFDLVCRTVAPAGYARVGFFALTFDAAQAVAAVGGAPPLVMSNYGEAYETAYRRVRRHEIDPVLALARDGCAPLIWSDIVCRPRVSNEQRTLLDERVKAGIHDEVTCPIQRPHGQRFALRFARGSPGPCERAHRWMLQILAIHFSYALIGALAAGSGEYPEASAGTSSPTMGLSDSPYIVVPVGCMLSQREREVLLWTARGKSASSIAIMLNLAENTVNHYVKNAMTKLGTSRRIVAVITAVRAGLIQP